MKNIAILSIMICMIFIAGCKTETPPAVLPSEPPAAQPAITNFEECVAAGNPVMESYPRQCAADGQTFVEQIESPYPDAEEQPAPQEETVAPPAPICGDKKCDSGENCDTCYKDCPCKDNEVCYHENCKILECTYDNECDDGDACTKDTCAFPMNPNARCAHEKITRCKNGDDCCPDNCNVDNDSDCGVVCGDGKCEVDEDTESCPQDCEEEE